VPRGCGWDGLSCRRNRKARGFLFFLAHWMPSENAPDFPGTEARQALQGALAKPGGAVVPDYYIAATWAEIGDKAKALESLKRADQHHSNWLIYLPYDPRFDSLRSDPGFRAAFQKAGTAKGGALSARK